MKSLVAAVLMAAAFPLSATADPPHQASVLFADLCSSCHTIGGGELAGPDLAGVTKLPDNELRAAIERMEANSRDLTPEEEKALFDLLRHPEANAVAAAAPAAPPSTLAPASPEIGRHLFYGQKALANGGSACFACHAVSGRGGNLARDLSSVHLRMPEATVLMATEKPPFPLMKATYATRPVTPQEAAHIAAFLKESSAAPLRAGEGRFVPEVAAGLAAVFLALIALFFRWRHESVRSQLLRDSRGSRS